MKQSPRVCTVPHSNAEGSTMQSCRNSASAPNVTVTAGTTSRHVNSGNAARFEHIGAVLMLECPMECYAVCTGKCVSTSPRRRGTSKCWGRYQSIRRKVPWAFRKLLFDKSVSPSVRLEQRGYHWTDFYKI